MILAGSQDGVRCVTQPDHAALAGRFADRWGNDEFDRPRTDAIVAAYVHDDGWFEHDRRPHLDGDGDPIDFHEVPAEAWIDIYDRGIESAVELDPYAGLLVSMHGTGLRRRRYGLSPEWPATPAAYRDFVDRQEDRQRQLLDELREDDRRDLITPADEALLSALHRSGDAPDDTDSRLWFDYRLLQAWDTISLSFCTTLSPPGHDEIDAVPTAASVPAETVTVEPLGGDEFRIEPYPFDEAPLEACVPARTVPTSAFDTGGELVRAYYESGRETVRVTLRRGDR